MASPILRQIDRANALTLVGLTLTLMSASFAVEGRFAAAILAMIWAGVVDLFDGFVARKLTRTDLQAEVGRHLDSLVDVCSFGFGPVLFAYAFGLRHPLFLLLLAAYLACVATRLAYFNSTGLAAEGDAQYFTGMPVTYAALFIPLAFVAHLILPQQIVVGLLAAVYAVLTTAMVTGARIRKPKGLWYLFFGLLALGLSALYAWAIATGRAL